MPGTPRTVKMLAIYQNIGLAVTSLSLCGELFDINRRPLTVQSYRATQYHIPYTVHSYQLKANKSPKMKTLTIVQTWPLALARFPCHRSFTTVDLKARLDRRGHGMSLWAVWCCRILYQFVPLLGTVGNWVVRGLSRGWRDVNNQCYWSELRQTNTGLRFSLETITAAQTEIHSLVSSCLFNYSLL